MQQQSVKASIAKARSTIARELMDWLHCIHRSRETAIPEDILVFFTQHWLPNHAGSSTLSGKMIAGPISLAGVKSHLAKELDVQGRVGTGTPQHSQATPCTPFRSET